MSDLKEKLRLELVELQGKISNLSKFLDGNKLENKVQNNLLRVQLKIMKSYEEVLELRICDFILGQTNDKTN